MLEGEEKEQEIEYLFEKIMKENVPNLVKEIAKSGQRSTGGRLGEAQRIPNKMDPEKTTPRHNIIKMPNVKDKERILKAARKKQLVTYKDDSMRLSADFSKETLQVRRDWQKVFKVMKSKDLQPQLLHPVKLSFRIQGQIKVLPRQGKTKGVHHHQAIII